MKGFANETVTVDVPEDGTGRKLDVFLLPLEASFTNWGLARKFGPLNSMRPAGDSSQVHFTRSRPVRPLNKHGKNTQHVMICMRLQKVLTFLVASMQHEEYAASYLRVLWTAQAPTKRLMQSAVFLVVGLGVLLLLRAVHRRFSGRRREGSGGSAQYSARRSPLKP